MSITLSHRKIIEGHDNTTHILNHFLKITKKFLLISIWLSWVKFSTNYKNIHGIWSHKKLTRGIYGEFNSRVSNN